MKDFGVDVNFEKNEIDIRPQSYQPIPYKIESDWSAASYWYEALSIVGKGRIFLNGLRQRSTQGDSRVAELFTQLGVNTEYTSEGVMLTSSENYTGEFSYDFTGQPDLAQTFAVTCCLREIPFHFRGIQSLKIKETDRVAALINELKKTGFLLVEPKEGELAWNGEKCEPAQDISIKTYDDHRMAMVFR